MRWKMIFAVVTMSACLGASQTIAGKSDQDAVQGVWRLIGGEMEGKALTKEKIQQLRKGPGEFELTFKGNVASPNNGEPPVTFKLDPAKKPKHIDLTLPGESKVMKGIYELAGDDFKLCMDPESKDRPTEFKIKEGSKAGVLVFKRVKQ